MSYYHLRFNVYAEPGFSVEKETWIYLAAPIDDSAMKKHLERPKKLFLQLKTNIMNNDYEVNIDDATIAALGLTLTDKHVNAEIAPSSRVFEYPHLPDVYVMESDLYGNRMPKESCFLAFTGQHGLIGKHVRVETLRHSTAIDIKQMVEENNQG